MAKSPRRQVSRIVGVSCLATALALPAAALAAPEALARTPYAAPDDPTPPPTPDTPGPGETGTPETPQPQTPDTGQPSTPEQPQTPDTGQPSTPASEQPGTPTGAETSPGTPQSPGLQQFGASTPKEVEERITALDLPEAEKQKLRDALAKAVAAITNAATPAAEREKYEQAVDGLNEALKANQALSGSPQDKAAYAKVLSTLSSTLQNAADPTTPAQDRADRLDIVRIVGNALKVTADPGTSPEDRALYMQLVQGISGALSIAVDPKATNGSTYQIIATEIAADLYHIQNPATPPADRAILVQRAGVLAAGILASVDPQTAPEKPQDQEAVSKAIEKATREANQAAATLQNPNASPQEQAAARQTLDALNSAPQNPRYLEFLAEVKKHDPPAACLQAIESRTVQAGWPEGAFWGLSDDVCGDTLAAAARDNTSRWNQLFQCVRDNAFSTCAAYIPQD